MSDLLTLPINSSVSGSMFTHTPVALIEPATWKIEDIPVAQMPIGSILVSPNGDAQATGLDGLVASIRAKGLLQPLIVAPDGRLLAGRRRLEAARRAGLELVPVCVCAVTSERSAIEIGLVENVERADLDPLTRAKAYRALIEQGATVEEIADLVGQGTSHIYQHLQLLDLHSQVQQALHARTLSFADGRALAPLQVEDQAAVLQEIRTAPKPLTSRQVKARVDARRVMRLVRQVNDESGQKEGDRDNADPPQEAIPNAKPVSGNYALLFEAEDTTNAVVVPETQEDPLEQLNALIAEMVAAAQGEDPVRAWARRLSHILEALQVQWHEADGKRKSAGAVQDRLL